MNILIAHKKENILEIVDNAKKKKNLYFLLALVYLIHFFSSYESIFSKPFNLVTIISITFLAFIFILLVKSFYKRDYSNLLQACNINYYKYKKSKFGLSKNIVLYLNNGKKRIVLIENNYQLELFRQVLNQLNIEKK
jgi:hypothetical protein